MKQQNKQAYTIIVVILIIGFLMVLTIGILKLVMDEMKDNRSLGNYQKAYIGAESAQELALLQIKENGYGYNEDMEVDFDRNILGSEKKDPILNYENNGSIPEINSTKPELSTIAPLGNVIIPLYTITKDTTTTPISFTENSVDDIILEVQGPNKSKISWNILSEKGGIANTGDNTMTGQMKSVDNTTNQLSYKPAESVNTFLSSHSSKANILLLFNSDATNSVTYSLKSNNTKKFTKPIIDVISTAEVGGYKQNIETKLNFAEMNSRAKYTIYSQ